MPRPKLKPFLLLLLSATFLADCETVQVSEETYCAALPALSDGGGCAELVSGETFTITFNELLDMIDTQPQRNCTPVPGLNVCADIPQPGPSPSVIPARGPAVIMPESNWQRMKTDLQTACRILGNDCTYSGISRVITNMNLVKSTFQVEK